MDDVMIALTLFSKRLGFYSRDGSMIKGWVILFIGYFTKLTFSRLSLSFFCLP